MQIISHIQPGFAFLCFLEGPFYMCSTIKIRYKLKIFLHHGRRNASHLRSIFKDDEYLEFLNFRWGRL